MKILKKLVKSQEQELGLAVLDKGEYELRQEFYNLIVSGDKWAKMTNDQRKEALSRIHSISLEEASQSNVASMNERLGEVESATFQQILSAGVDWITPDVIRLIAQKGEHLQRKGKVTQVPAASAYTTLIIPSKSKPTKPHIIVVYPNGKVECKDCQGYSASSLCAHVVAESLKLGTLEAYLKWLVASKRKTGGINYSRAITHGMPAGRGRKGERQPRSRRGRQTTNIVVPRNALPSRSITGTRENENDLGGAQLHRVYPETCQPSVGTHRQAVYNPPVFPSFQVERCQFPYAPTFHSGTPPACFRAAPPYWPMSNPPPAAAGAWHSGLSPHSYYVVALPKNARKCYECGEKFL